MLIIGSGNESEEEDENEIIPFVYFHDIAMVLCKNVEDWFLDKSGNKYLMEQISINLGLKSYCFFADVDTETS